MKHHLQRTNPNVLIFLNSYNKFETNDKSFGQSKVSLKSIQTAHGGYRRHLVSITIQQFVFFPYHELLNKNTVK